MGEARRRGTKEQRKAMAITAAAEKQKLSRQGLQKSKRYPGLAMAMAMAAYGGWRP